MKNNLYPTAEEIAAEAREALRRLPKKTPEEDFTDMVRKGFINAKGEVTRLIGGSAEPEPNYENWTHNAKPGKKDVG
jgi:hypothetical protein